MAFQVTPNVHIQRDDKGVVRHIRHLQEPYLASRAGLSAMTPRLLGEDYTRQVAGLFSLDTAMLSTLSETVTEEILNEGSQLRFAGEKSVMQTTVVEYRQTHWGIPVWEAGFNVTMHDGALRVTSSQCSVHHDLKVERPDPESEFAPEQITQSLFSRLINADRVKITGTRWLVYRYEDDKRYDPESRRKDQELQQAPPTLKLPSVAREIEDGSHYVVTEVLFSLFVTGWGHLNWRAFVENRTGSVLYLRAFVACAFGNIFRVDPLTITGDTSITAASPASTLDPLTTVVTLPGLTPPSDPADPQSLEGEYVKVEDLNAPTIAPPTAALPTGNFSYSATTDNFSAVNAYYHCDALFRLMEGMGFNLSSYFGGTSFPVPVDHRGKNSAVNAHCSGDPQGDGIGEFAFGVVSSGDPVGIAADWRVVLHEFGHGILHDHVDGPNFGFAHSAGDSLAAILNDPGSNAPDRFLTFPWVIATRRHDRDIASGWAWGGSNDTGGYNSEQILATTHFRIYRSTGGDASSLSQQEFAARYMLYLIFKATGGLTPTSNPSNPDPWATALMDADQGTADFEGHPGGAFHKVVRWGFEKQGLYQPSGASTPVTTVGDPPDVDVYIDDGRNGEYEFQANFWNTTDIWNRLSADGGTSHETPVTNTSNYLYVRVKNRGTQTANNVVVRAFHCVPATGLVWPDDWTPLTTPELTAGSIASGGDTVVGPFEWTPQVVGHECVLAYASADGDMANADPATSLPCAAGPIPHWRLVPFDNNIGQRNLAPVAGGGGLLALLEAFRNRLIKVRNPFHRVVRVKLDAQLPDFLRKRRWGVRFESAGGGDFTLGPRADRDVKIRLVPGEEFTVEEVRAAGVDASIDVNTLVDGLLVGGMSYAIDPELKVQPAEAAEEDDGKGGRPCTGPAKKLLDCLDIPVDDVKKVRIKRITVDIHVEEDC